MQELIVVDQLTKVYRTGTVSLQALAGISLSVVRGSFMAMMGLQARASLRF